MGLDIKIPIGLMFLIFGIILTLFGLVTDGDVEMYAKSLNFNVNLWSGISMLAFGSFMVLTSSLIKRNRKKKED